MPETRTLFHPNIDRALIRVADGWSFAVDFAYWAIRPPYHAAEVLRQCQEVGLKTLPLITLTGFITGVVFTQQSRPSLEAFGATSWLPSLIVIAMVRSLAPLVTALICAGKVGSSIGAELGSMRVTEQIEAMEVSAVNPFKYLVVTRTLAITFMTPVLTMYFGFTGTVGSYLNVRSNEGTTLVGFVQTGFASIDTTDIGAAIVRALTFGLLVGLISSAAGFYADRGTAGVGKAANQAVVRSMLAVFLGEIFIVQILATMRSM
jgi:phospholipid/cholesterol/gamma-HCH transport system permease protein